MCPLCVLRLVATLRNTKGKPKPAMWEGLLPVGVAPDTPTATGGGGGGGWRQVVADGKTQLDGEV